MDAIGKLATAGSTVICALAIGYVMQESAGGAATPTTLAAIPVEQAVLDPIESSEDAPLEIHEIKLMSALPPANFGIEAPISIFRTAAAAVLTEETAPTEPAVPVLGCSVVLYATPADRASIDLSLSAPCFGNERVTIHHNGMMFTEFTSDEGMLDITVPALNEEAIFVAEFSNGKGAVAMVDVPELEGYDRIALQWLGETGFQFHAREFGAEDGEDGHVWSGAVATGAAGAGYVTRLGRDDALLPQLVEIYTYPRIQSDLNGTITLTVEAEVTEANCGRDVAAQSLELRGGAPLRTRDLVLTIPNCSAVGDFLVLNNLMEDLKIAAR